MTRIHATLVHEAQNRDDGAQGVIDDLAQWFTEYANRQGYSDATMAYELRRFFDRQHPVDLGPEVEVEEDPPVAAGVVCTCPADICPAHGRLDHNELKQGRRVRE